AHLTERQGEAERREQQHRAEAEPCEELGEQGVHGRRLPWDEGTAPARWPGPAEGSPPAGPPRAQGRVLTCRTRVRTGPRPSRSPRGTGPARSGRPTPTRGR